MGMAKRHGRTVQLGTLVSSIRGKSTEKENLSGKTAATTKETSCRGNLKASENISSQISIKSMKVSSETAQWKVKARKSGLMGRSMKEISRMERKMGKVPSNGLMAISILDHGNKASSMELVSGQVLKREDLRNKVSGSMERDTDGSTDSNCFLVNHLTLRKQEYENLFIHN